MSSIELARERLRCRTKHRTWRTDEVLPKFQSIIELGWLPDSRNDGDTGILDVNVRRTKPMPSRPCRFCLSLQEDSVFADFDEDDDGRLYLTRISFDGYGCHRLPVSSGIGRMPPTVSARIRCAAEEAVLDDPLLSRALRSYFADNAPPLWEDALRDHDLI